MLETTEGARQADGVIGSSIVTSHRFPRVETRRKGLRSIDGGPDKVKRLWLTSLKKALPKCNRHLGEVHPAHRPLLSANQKTTPATCHRFDAKAQGRSPVR